MSSSFDIDAVLQAWSPDHASLSPMVLRLARRVPQLHHRLDPLLSVPVDRALAGLGPAPSPGLQPDLRGAILACQAIMDGGGSVPAGIGVDLERRAQGDLRWWVPAVRIHVFSSPERERQVRMDLSQQDLPYVFPGDLHALQVELLAGGDRVVQALHVDWLRKLTTFAADALILDARAGGLWFWPVLRFLDDRKLSRPLGKLARARKIPSGGRGMLAAYLARLGGDPAKLLGAGDPHDQLVCALALASERPR